MTEMFSDIHDQLRDLQDTVNMITHHPGGNDVWGRIDEELAQQSSPGSSINSPPSQKWGAPYSNSFIRPDTTQSPRTQTEIRTTSPQHRKESTSPLGEVETLYMNLYANELANPAVAGSGAPVGEAGLDGNYIVHPPAQPVYHKQDPQQYPTTAPPRVAKSASTRSPGASPLRSASSTSTDQFQPHLPTWLKDTSAKPKIVDHPQVVSPLIHVSSSPGTTSGTSSPTLPPPPNFFSSSSYPPQQQPPLHSHNHLHQQHMHPAMRPPYPPPSSTTASSSSSNGSTTTEDDDDDTITVESTSSSDSSDDSSDSDDSDSSDESKNKNRERAPPYPRPTNQPFGPPLPPRCYQSVVNLPTDPNMLPPSVAPHTIQQQQLMQMQMPPQPPLPVGMGMQPQLQPPQHMRSNSNNMMPMPIPRNGGLNGNPAGDGTADGLTSKNKEKWLYVQKMLMAGQKFRKHCVNNKAKSMTSKAVDRFVFLSRDAKYLCWCPTSRVNYINYATRFDLDYTQPTYGGKKDNNSFIPLNEIRRIMVGDGDEVPVRWGRAALDFWKKSAKTGCLLSFIATKRTLTLEATTAEQAEYYAWAWNFYLFNKLNTVHNASKFVPVYQEAPSPDPPGW